MLISEIMTVELDCRYEIARRNGYWAAVAVEEPEFAPRYNVPATLRHHNFGRAVS